MPIEYYIGVAVGIFSVLIAYVLLRLTKRGSMCDKCKYMTFKDWKGKKWCRKKGCWLYFNPRYCNLYEEKGDEHGST